MTSTRRISAAVALLATGLTACTPSERPAAEGAGEDATMAVLTSEMAAFQTEVRATLDQIRFDVQAMQAEITGDFEERWVELARATDQAEAEMLGDLDRLAVATAEEADEIRRAASDRLAELEAEVVRSEVETAQDAESIGEAVTQHLEALASDLEELRRVATEIPAAPGEPTESPAMAEREAGPEVGVDPETVAALDARLEEIRVAALTTLEAGDETVEEAREELGEALAEVTREVRRHWYSARWQAEAE
jgi:hypothetical protein